MAPEGGAIVELIAAPGRMKTKTTFVIQHRVGCEASVGIIVHPPNKGMDTVKETDRRPNNLMFTQASCDQGAVSAHFLASSCKWVCVPDTHGHYAVSLDYRLEGRRSETANTGHTSTFSAHQLDTDDERGWGSFVVQDRYLWLGSLLEGHQCWTKGE